MKIKVRFDMQVTYEGDFTPEARKTVELKLAQVAERTEAVMHDPIVQLMKDAGIEITWDGEWEKPR